MGNCTLEKSCYKYRISVGSLEQKSEVFILTLRPSQIIRKGLFINKGKKIRFGTELKLSICHGIAPMRKRIPPAQGVATTVGLCSC